MSHASSTKAGRIWTKAGSVTVDTCLDVPGIFFGIVRRVKLPRVSASDYPPIPTGTVAEPIANYHV